MTEEVDISDERQWSLLWRFHSSGVCKLGKFLKENGFPHDTTIKPMGKYYTHIRNKNLRIMALPSEERLDFIRGEMGLLTDTKQVPSVNRMNLIDIMVGLNVEGKRKLIGILSDMSAEDKSEFIRVLSSV